MRILFSLTSLLAVVGLGAGCDSRSPQPNDDAARTAAAPQQKTAPSAGCGGRLVFGDSVGPIRLGMSLDELRRPCPIGRETAVPTAYGQAERRLSVLLGPDTAVVTIHISCVRGLSTLRVLLARPLLVGYGVAWGLLVQSPSQRGLTFRIAGRYPDHPGPVKYSATMARVPLTAVVDRIRIDGCERDEDARFS